MSHKVTQHVDVTDVFNLVMVFIAEAPLPEFHFYYLQHFLRVKQSKVIKRLQ